MPQKGVKFALLPLALAATGAARARPYAMIRPDAYSGNMCPGTGAECRARHLRL